MTTVGRWSPNKVRARVLDGTWVSTEELGGMVLLAPTSIAYTGTSATIGANGSVEFSAVSSLSLNGVFSADYDNYMVSLSGTASADDFWNLRYRASGTDDTSSSYVRQYLDAYSTSVNADRATATFCRMWYGGSVYRAGMTFATYGPFLAQPTALRNVAVTDYGNAYLYDIASTHSVSSSYDGFTLLRNGASATLSGLVSIYGLVGA